MEEGHLNQILDENIVNEGNTETLSEVANLARCLRVTREERPTMKEVAMEQSIHGERLVSVQRRTSTCLGHLHFLMLELIVV